MTIEKIKTLPVTPKQRQNLIKAIEKTKEQIAAFERIISECEAERDDSIKDLRELEEILENGIYLKGK